MFSFLKWSVGCVLLTLPFFAALLAGSGAERDIRHSAASSFSRIETRISEIAHSVQRRFAAQAYPSPAASTFRASDPRHLAVRDRFLAEHFAVEQGVHRCRLRIEGTTFHCEIRGLRLEGPHPVPVDNEEAALGVSTRLSYRFEAQAHRLRGTENDPAPWQTGVPPSLSRLDLILRGGDWSVHMDASSLIPETHSD